MLHVALYQPLIPPNTGNIARQCVGMKARLHLIGPVAFDLSAHAVKRAGLDYWKHLDLQRHESPAGFLGWLASRGGASGRKAAKGHARGPWLVTKRGALRYDQAPYADEDVLIFGNEDRGLPRSWHERWPERRVFIPIVGQVRSYNLSNAVAIVLAQAMLRAGMYGGE
jgi:tRNA (cytidine/uridine-2'-O-)-methyltransferase